MKHVTSVEGQPQVAQSPNVPSGILETRDLRKYFQIGRRRAVLRAVDGVSLEIGRGETLALLGESGSGKSTLGRTIVRLHQPTSGSIIVDGVDIASLMGRALRESRGRLQMIFQASTTAFNPRRTLGASIVEPLRSHGIGSPAEQRRRAEQLFEETGLRPQLLDTYPHEVSGGQRQRAGIARALALRPNLIVADEPTASLDLSTQAQIVNLVLRLQEQDGLSFLFITHDIDLAHHVSHRTAVMYLGKIVESAPTDDLIRLPLHPYTAALVSSSNYSSRLGRARIPLRGEVPSPIDPPSGCSFRTRCPVAQPLCAEKEPELMAMEGSRRVACHFAGSIAW